jgi:LysR family transcriptional regulator, glycine cleavage system transcriptional activator
VTSRRAKSIERSEKDGDESSGSDGSSGSIETGTPRPRARRLLPSLTALQFFDAAARHLSFTRAAAELCVTQSAISRQIRQLEDFIGQQLFHRSTNRLILTSTGAEYATAVRLVLDQAEAATLQLMAYDGKGAQLTLALLPTFGSRWLVPRIGEFVALHPSLQLNIKTYIEPFEFETSDVDAAIHFGSDAWVGAVCHRLMGEVAVPVCAPSLLGGRQPLSDPRAVVNFPLLQHTTRPLAWLEWCSQVGAPATNALGGARFDHFYMMIQAAIAGLGVALLPRFLVHDELTSGRLVVAADHELKTASAYWLVYPEKKAQLPAVGQFRDWLLNIVEADKTGD